MNRALWVIVSVISFSMVILLVLVGNMYRLDWSGYVLLLAWSASAVTGIYLASEGRRRG